MMQRVFLTIALCLWAFAPSLRAQEATDSVAANEVAADGVLMLPPLFEYPVAPEELAWNDRSDWLAQHFWDSFDFKQKSVGQSQLLHAFRTYIVPLHMANRDVALESVASLLKKLSKSPALLFQFVQAAERTIYEPQTSELYIDEVYVQFLEAITSHKKIPDLRKARYKAQLKSLANCLVGSKMPAFGYVGKEGDKREYAPSGVPAIIEFGDADCSDCRITRLRLETDSELQGLVKEGKAEILFISPDIDAESVEEWESHVAGYSQDWKVGRAESLEESLDLRVVPCLYIVSADGTIVSKNATTDAAKEYVKQQCK